MTSLCHIALSHDSGRKVPVAELGGSHGLTAASAKMYDRFFGLQSVLRQNSDQTHMLGSVLQKAVASLPDQGRTPGILVYCKTQTHNTQSDQNWLRRLADAAGLAQWEVHALSMTSCASALVCLHFIQSCGTTAPVIVLTGEKAFHPSVARLTVGLLAEVPVAAVLNPMLHSLNSRRWHKHGNQKSDVHEYAENYYLTMGANPFQKTQPIGTSR